VADLFLVGPKTMTLEEAADSIEKFVNDTGGRWDWDDFISIRQKDPELEAVRLKCVSVADDFPSTDRRRYCSDGGFDALRYLLKDLRSRSRNTIVGLPPRCSERAR
jgi:hypothetical protein